jgi:hypothetical protein
MAGGGWEVDALTATTRSAAGADQDRPRKEPGKHVERCPEHGAGLATRDPTSASPRSGQGGAVEASVMVFGVHCGGHGVLLVRPSLGLCMYQYDTRAVPIKVY